MASFGTMIKVFIGLLLFMMVGAWIWKRYMENKRANLQEKIYMNKDMSRNVEAERKAEYEHKKAISDNRYGLVNTVATNATGVATKVVDLVPSLLAEEKGPGPSMDRKGGRNIATIRI